MPRNEFRGGQRLADPAGSPEMAPERLDAPVPSHCRERYLTIREGSGEVNGTRVPSATGSISCARVSRFHARIPIR